MLFGLNVTTEETTISVYSGSTISGIIVTTDEFFCSAVFNVSFSTEVREEPDLGLIATNTFPYCGGVVVSPPYILTESVFGYSLITELT